MPAPPSSASAPSPPFKKSLPLVAKEDVVAGKSVDDIISGRDADYIVISDRDNPVVARAMNEIVAGVPLTSPFFLPGSALPLASRKLGMTNSIIKATLYTI